MCKKFFAAITLLITTANSPIILADDFGAGMGIGAVVGLAGGTILNNLTKPAPAVVICEDPYIAEKQEELCMRERHVRRQELQQRRQARADELRRRQEEKWAAQNDDSDTEEVTIVETRTTSKAKEVELRERELALKEKETELELLKEKNREIELAIKQKELELELLKSREKDKKDNKHEEQTIIRKTSRRTIK